MERVVGVTDINSSFDIIPWSGHKPSSQKTDTKLQDIIVN